MVLSRALRVKHVQGPKSLVHRTPTSNRATPTRQNQSCLPLGDVKFSSLLGRPGTPYSLQEPHLKQQALSTTASASWQ